MTTPPAAEEEGGGPYPFGKRIEGGRAVRGGGRPNGRTAVKVTWLPTMPPNQAKSEKTMSPGVRGLFPSANEGRPPVIEGGPWVTPGPREGEEVGGPPFG